MDESRAPTAFAALDQRVMSAWLAAQAAPNTQAAYRTDLTTFGRWCATRQLIALSADAAALAEFQLARESMGDTDATMRRRWSSLSSFFQYAQDAGLTSSNPAAAVLRPTVQPGDPSPTSLLSRGAVDAYVAVAAALDPRLDALVRMIVFEGLKLGEALALDVDDVSGRPPKVVLTVRRRGGTRRMVLTPSTSHAVHRCAGRRRGEPLLTSGRSSRVTPARLTRFGADHLFRQLSDEGAPRVTANALRRYYITASHRAGVELDDVRENAGLADVRAIRRYISGPRPST